MQHLSLEELGQLMRTMREKKKDSNGSKISRESIGKAVGVSGQTVYLWENGKQHPGFLNVVKFCEFLGITLDELLGVKKNASCTC